MATVTWSDTALRGVEEIHDWIAVDRPRTAEAFAQEILDAVNSLETLPERGRPAGRGLRELTFVRPCIIRYRYDAEGDAVTIMAVWHGARERGRWTSGSHICCASGPWPGLTADPGLSGDRPVFFGRVLLAPIQTDVRRQAPVASEGANA